MQKIPYQTDQNNPTIRAYTEAVEKGKRNQHVLPYGKAWAIANLVSEKVALTFNNKLEAVKYAKSHAAQGTTVFIHSLDGRIKERVDY